jgi:methanogenic corrinoid protein MtbC1
MIVTSNSILKPLLTGDRKTCSDIIKDMVEASVPVKEIYEELLRPALYQIGELWEQNKISVATEHLASAIVESLLNEIYLNLKISKKTEKTAVISCIENEHHQIGARMVSDFFELQGWKVLFLGANTPKKDLLEYLQIINPNVVCISLSIYFHLPVLLSAIEDIKSEFYELPLLVGGQAFTRGGWEYISSFNKVNYIPDLQSLESYLTEYS